MKRTATWSAVAVLALAASSLALDAPTHASVPQTASPQVAASSAAAPLGRDAAVSVARAHLATHAAEAGINDTDVAGLVVSSVVPTQHNGLTDVYFQQRAHSLDVSNAMVNVAVGADGQVVRVASNAVSSAAKRTNATTPKISDVQAAQRAAAALGLQPTRSFASTDVASGPGRARDLGDGGISADPISARLVYEPTDAGDLRLTWELVINQLDGKHWWQIRMDARTGAELGRTDWVAEDSHTVFPAPVEAPSFATPVNTRTTVNDPATSASPFGWNDTDGVAGPESTLTLGNNVQAYTDTNADNSPDPGSSPDGGAGLVFNFPLDLTQAPSTYRPAAVSNLYFANNRLHDLLYPFGFDEASGNFQVNNYSHGGAGGDPVHAEAQDGAGVNNANFGTPPDGGSPRMQMFIFNTTAPNRDGDLDNGVIFHEYGHGVSNRLTGGPANVSCLGNQEEAGEGWSDFLAYMLTMPTGTEPATGRGLGTYVEGQPTTGSGIRAKKYSTSMAINNETYDSIKSFGGDEHFVGEVWAEMLWEVTYALIAQDGFSADLSDPTAGNVLSLQLVLDGLKMQACSPGFVDARDAIIAADQVDNAGANECLLWTAFAKRGLGFSASQGSSGSATDGTQAFNLPPYCNGLRWSRTATPTSVTVGGTLTYGFHLINTKTDPAGLPGVVVTGTVGDHASYVAGSATCGGTYDNATRTVTFPVGTMASGATQDCEFRAVTDAAPGTLLKASDDFEPDLSGWTATHGAGSANWALSTAAPHSPTHSALGSEPETPADQYLTLAAPVAVTAGDTLAFWQRRGLESGYDGGVVEVSANGGGTWTDIGAAAFTQNGYNGTLQTGGGNPIEGRQAFTGNSAYVRSVASLSAYVGQSVLVRFRLGTDTGTGGTGWDVDDVTIGTDVSTTSQGSASATGVTAQNLSLTTQILGVPVTPPPPPPALTAPGAPVITKAVARSSRKAKVTFSPAPNGGSPVTSYSVTCTGKHGAKTKTKTGSGSPIKVKGLTPGKKYTCTVTATNAIGTGPASAKSKKFKTPRAGAPHGSHHRGVPLGKQ